uniref:VOC family protein n=2 Tax=Lactococcus lactis subsp. cremoris TaxID=1359 RepID=A0AA47LWB7_LACLC|nr:VOC family protein [Lactococcus cremoris]
MNYYVSVFPNSKIKKSNIILMKS